jgi:large-conductance mechanosensitive channel
MHLCFWCYICPSTFSSLLSLVVAERTSPYYTCSMGGLVVKELLYQAKLNNYDNFLNNTVGLVCISLLFFVIVWSVNRI